MRLLIILFFVAVKSYGQSDSTEYKLLEQRLREKGWSNGKSADSRHISINNGKEFFPDFYLNNFIVDSVFSESRTRYPRMFKSDPISSLLPKTFEPGIDTLTRDLGKHLTFIQSDSTTRIILWDRDKRTIHNTFSNIQGKWYLIAITVLDR